MFFLKNHAKNKARWLVPDLFLFLKKALYEVKASGLQLSFNIRKVRQKFDFLENEKSF